MTDNHTSGVMARVVAPVSVLLVEDRPVVVATLSRRFEERGHQVATVGTRDAAGVDAHFDVGLFDLDEGGEQALRVAEGLVARAALERVVFFGATATAVLRRQAAEIGVFVDKRKGIPTVVETVESAGAAPSSEPTPDLQRVSTS